MDGQNISKEILRNAFKRRALEELQYQEDCMSRLRRKKNYFAQIFDPELRRVVRCRCLKSCVYRGQGGGIIYRGRLDLRSVL